ncbi:MAG: MFS transporter, partial [Alphaproteobacteria bacterium]|nr:MFS transporter [Alphaproteobacteria bacterium]
GAVRDFWNPFGLGDRGYFLLFGSLGALLLFGFSFAGTGVATLFAAFILSGIAFILMFAAWNGLGTRLGQEHAMSGQMSAVWNFSGTLALTVGLVAGGFLSDRLEGLSARGAVRALLLISAGLMAIIALLGLWKPRAVFAHLGSAGPHRSITRDLSRLARHWPIYPALAIGLLWNFSPGTQTVLQYFMSNRLHASDADWGAYNAIANISFLPTYVLFGWLSPRLSLKSLLWWGTLIGIPQYVPLLFVHTVSGVFATAVASGLMGGICTAAFLDLLMRACPKGVEGTLMMFSWCMYALAGNFGNLIGTKIYESGGGLAGCVVLTTLVYAAILPLLLTLPKGLIETADSRAQGR